MLRVELSIKAGRLLPSAILRRLGTYSRKNRLYFAFRELGRAIRTAWRVAVASLTPARYAAHPALAATMPVMMVCQG